MATANDEYKLRDQEDLQSFAQRVGWKMGQESFEDFVARRERGDSVMRMDAGDEAPAALRRADILGAAAREASNAASAARTPALGSPELSRPMTPQGTYGHSEPEEKAAGEAHLEAAQAHDQAADEFEKNGEASNASQHRNAAASHMNSAADHARNAGASWDHDAHPLKDGRLDCGVTARQARAGFLKRMHAAPKADEGDDGLGESNADKARRDFVRKKTDAWKISKKKPEPGPAPPKSASEAKAEEEGDDESGEDGDEEENDAPSAEGAQAAHESRVRDAWKKKRP